MTEDRHDAQIRGLVAELAASAPPAPAFNRIADQLAQHGAQARAVRAGAGLAVTDISERPDADVPLYVRDGARRPARTKPWRAMAALVALGLATAGGVFAYGSLTADDGTATPEQAVKHFVDAFSASDVAGMLESLPPSERVVLRESLESLNDQGARLRLTRDLDLANVSGVHLKVSGLQLSTTGLAADVATVHVKGTLQSSADDHELPIGDAARDALVDSLPDHGYQGVADALDRAVNTNTSGGHTIDLVTVKEDGGWHVSVWYTLAEYIRAQSGASVPNFGHSPITPVGAASPDAAARSLVENSGDYDKVVSLTTPDESRVLYDYVPVLTAKSRRHVVSRTVVHRLDTHVDGDGDRRIVHIDSFDLETTTTYAPDPGQTSESIEPQISRTTFDGSCITTAYSAQSVPSGGSVAPDVQTVCRKDALAKGTTPLEWSLATTLQLVVEQHDGRWYVSPVRSLVNGTVARLAQIPDAKAFKGLTSSRQGTSVTALLAPIDTLDLAFGSPLESVYLSLPSSDSSSSSSSSGESLDIGSSGPVPTTAVGSSGPSPSSPTSSPASSSATSIAPSAPGTATTFPAPPASAAPASPGTPTTAPTTAPAGG